MQDKIILWKSKNFIIVTYKNPHIPPNEGCHIVVYPIKESKNAWEDPKLTGITFELASKVAKVVIDEQIADWANLQYNGNWGLLKGNKSIFHVHIYGRKKTSKTWGQPVDLPKLPETFNNKQMDATTISKLKQKLKEVL